MKLLLQEVIIKFVLKSLSLEDGMASRILQIEATPAHTFYNHIYMVKQFLLWKREREDGPIDPRGSSSLRSLSLFEVNREEFLYRKEEIKSYQCHQCSGICH